MHNNSINYICILHDSKTISTPLIPKASDTNNWCELSTTIIMYYCNVGSPLVALLFGYEFSIIDVMAAIRAALKFGSAVIVVVASFTASTNEAVSVLWAIIDWSKFFEAGKNSWANIGACWLCLLSSCGAPCGRCEQLLVSLRVRSKVIVGNGAEADKVAMLCEDESDALSNMFGCKRLSELGIDPERSIDAAADVVHAIALAVGGSIWLCCPSYVVTNTLGSSALLCTYISPTTW